MKKQNIILLIISIIIFIVLLSTFLITGYAELPEALLLTSGIYLFLYFLINRNYKDEANQIVRNLSFKMTSKSRLNNLKSVDDIELNNFKIIADKLYDGVKGKLKIQRVKIILGIILISLYIILVAGGLSYLLAIHRGDFSDGEIFFAFSMIFVIGFTGYIAALPYLKSKGKYVEIYKNGVVKKFIEYINVNMKYEPVISKEEKTRIEASYRNLNLDNYTEIETSDYLSGKIIDNCDIEIVDMVLKRYDKTRIDGRNGQVSREFNRTFAIINKQFSVPMKILNRNTLRDGMIENNNAYSMIYFHNKELFDEYFILDCNPNIKIEEYVKEGFFDFVKNFRKEYEIEFDIIFKDKIYIRFFTEGLFEPKIFGKAVNKESIYKYYIINKFIEELVEYL